MESPPRGLPLQAWEGRELNGKGEIEILTQDSI